MDGQASTSAPRSAARPSSSPLRHDVCSPTGSFRTSDALASPAAQRMSQIHSIEGLEIDEDLALQRAEWRTGRAAWIGFAALLLAGLAGLFGSGPISHGAIRGQSVGLEYERIA